MLTTAFQTAPSQLFFCEYIYVKTFLHWFISRKYVFTDVLQNKCSWKFLKIHRKTPVPDPLDSSKDVFQRIWKNLLEHIFYRISLHDCFWFQFNLFTILRRFYFRTDQHLFKIPSYFRVYQNSLPRASWASIFFCIE